MNIKTLPLFLLLSSLAPHTWSADKCRQAIVSSAKILAVGSAHKVRSFHAHHHTYSSAKPFLLIAPLAALAAYSVATDEKFKPLITESTTPLAKKQIAEFKTKLLSADYDYFLGKKINTFLKDASPATVTAFCDMILDVLSTPRSVEIDRIHCYEVLLEHTHYLKANSQKCFATIYKRLPMECAIQGKVLAIIAGVSYDESIAALCWELFTDSSRVLASGGIIGLQKLCTYYPEYCDATLEYFATQIGKEQDGVPLDSSIAHACGVIGKLYNDHSDTCLKLLRVLCKTNRSRWNTGELNTSRSCDYAFIDPAILNATIKIISNDRSRGREAEPIVRYYMTCDNHTLQESAWEAYYMYYDSHSI